MSETEKTIVDVTADVAAPLPHIPVSDPEKALSSEEITFEESSKLTDAQKTALKLIYTKAKEAVENTIASPTVESALKVTSTLAAIAKLVEALKMGGKSLPGATKKLITLELGSMLIKDLVKDGALKANIIAAYDVLAATTLETLIDVSNSVNIGNGQTVSTACTGCFSFLSSALKKKSSA